MRLLVRGVPELMPMGARMEAYWVEGLGNEVVAGCVLSATVVILVLYLLRARARNLYEDTSEQNETMSRTRGVLGRRGDVGDSAELESCPICLSHLSFPVDTNCGHTFCANCILSYWEHDQWPQPSRCPVCRNQVILLLPCAALSASNQPDLWSRVVDYNRRFSGQPRSMMQYLHDVLAVVNHMWRLLFTADGVVLLYRLHVLLLLALLLIYVFSPLDLIPEAVFGVLGYLDDIVILFAVLSYASQIYRHYVTNT